MSPPAVSVVILSYNSAEFLPVCLEELGRSRGVELEVIVVDNNSRDDSEAIARAHPLVDKTIQTGGNLGYSGGNNVGWREASHPYLVFLNPDCCVTRDALRSLIRPLIDDPTIGITGAKLYYPHSRKIQHAGGIRHPNAMSEHHGAFQIDDGQWDEDADVDYVTGALIGIRREEMEALGGFDEEFHPAYYEESDLAVRMQRSGRRVRYVASSVGYHWESPGLELNSPRFVRTSYRSRMIWLVKNYSLAQLLFVFLPFEWRWFWGPFACGFRKPVIRSYVSGAVFAAKCALRLRRRPPNVRNRIPPP
ncbi:glycosyltransferase family 2 protein [bacterium]|nr:glycosyltransferase family 2 protein [bacterium]